MRTLRQGDVPASRKREERNSIAPNEIQIIALSDLLDNKEAAEEKIVLFLSSFSCRDADVEHFLHKTAIFVIFFSIISKSTIKLGVPN